MESVAELYRVFSRYRLATDFEGCPCCVSADHSRRLATLPLRSLSFDDLEQYAVKAMTTWGKVEHFKYFLPRLFELTIEHRDDFMDLAVVFGKLKYGDVQSWKLTEQEAITKFFREYWDLQLSKPPTSPYDSYIDSVLCGLSNGSYCVAEFLDSWLLTPSSSAKQHLATLVENNASSILSRGEMSSAFWQKHEMPHAQTLTWLRSDNTLKYLESALDQFLSDDSDAQWVNALDSAVAMLSTIRSR